MENQNLVQSLNPMGRQLDGFINQLLHNGLRGATTAEQNLLRSTATAVLRCFVVAFGLLDCLELSPLRC